MRANIFSNSSARTAEATVLSEAAKPQKEFHSDLKHNTREKGEVKRQKR
jgi:hypothetical protein